MVRRGDSKDGLQVRYIVKKLVGIQASCLLRVQGNVMIVFELEATVEKECDGRNQKKE